MVEHSPSMCKALGLIPALQQRETKQKHYKRTHKHISEHLHKYFKTL